MPAILINGQSAEQISVLDRGFQYGDGLFETLRVAVGRPRRWQRHMARLAEGCRRLGIAMPDQERLLDEALNLCAGKTDAVLKITVTRGSSQRGYAPPSDAQATRVLALSEAPVFPAEYAVEGVAVRICETRLAVNPLLAGMKHLNRLEQVLARAEWGTEDGYAEGLMRDNNNNNVIEGTMSNLFSVQAGTNGPLLKTPLLDQCGVRGVTRDCILEAAVGLGIDTQETPISLDELYQSDELFLSNSLIGIWPIRQLEERVFPVGPMTTRLSQALESMDE